MLVAIGFIGCFLMFSFIGQPVGFGDHEHGAKVFCYVSKCFIGACTRFDPLKRVSSHLRIESDQMPDAYELYYEMYGQRVLPDLETYNTLMKGSVRASYWQGALQMLDTIRQAKQQPDVVSYTTAIDACRTGFLWQEALHLCFEMQLPHGRMIFLLVNGKYGCKCKARGNTRGS